VSGAPAPLAQKIAWRKKVENLKEYQKICRVTAKKFKSREMEILTWGLGIVGRSGITDLTRLRQ